VVVVVVLAGDDNWALQWEEEQEEVEGEVVEDCNVFGDDTGIAVVVVVVVVDVVEVADTEVVYTGHIESEDGIPPWQEKDLWTIAAFGFLASSSARRLPTASEDPSSPPHLRWSSEGFYAWVGAWAEVGDVVEWRGIEMEGLGADLAAACVLLPASLPVEILAFPKSGTAFVAKGWAEGERMAGRTTKETALEEFQRGLQRGLHRVLVASPDMLGIEARLKERPDDGSESEGAVARPIARTNSRTPTSTTTPPLPLRLDETHRQ
jgi:hypothetical protein